MKIQTQFTAFYMAAMLIVSFITFAGLKSCADSIDHDSQRAVEYQAQFQNANEHEVFVRRLGAK